MMALTSGLAPKLVEGKAALACRRAQRAGCLKRPRTRPSLTLESRCGPWTAGDHTDHTDEPAGRRAGRRRSDWEGDGEGDGLHGALKADCQPADWVMTWGTPARRPEDRPPSRPKKS